MEMRRCSASPSRNHRRSLSSTLMEESVAAAAAVVHRWHPDTSCSLFLHSSGGDHEFLGAVADLHRAMLFFASDANNDGIVQAQELLQSAMRRLDMELHLLLLDQDLGADSIRAVADAMMSAGYGKECLATFKSVRRAALATKLCWSPPPVPLTSSRHQLSWEQVDTNMIQPWLAAAPVALSSLFAAERELCDSVFAGVVAEAVFAGIVNEQATSLLAMAEAAVARARRAPERLFRVLDVHDTLTELLPAIVSVFGHDSEIANRAALVVAKAAEASRGTLLSFEAAIHKETSSSKQADGGVHPLTRYVMNYLIFLADYQPIAIGDQQLQLVVAQALLSKLESKAGSYREAALSYLFLANNTHYVATKVSGSSRLQAVLGEGWAEEHSAKARAHVHVYVRAAWSKVLAMITSSSNHHHLGRQGGVEEAVMAAVAMQDQWTAADDEMAQALRVAATAAVIPKYRMFYRRYGAALTLTPGDVTTMIAALFNHQSIQTQ